MSEQREPDGVSSSGARSDAVLDDIGLVLPESARVLASRLEGERDRAAFAKVEVSSDELDALVDAAGFARDDFEETARVYLGPDRDWWDPHAHESLPTAQRYLPDGRVLNVGLARVDRPVILVYLMWHET